MVYTSVVSLLVVSTAPTALVDHHSLAALCMAVSQESLLPSTSSSKRSTTPVAPPCLVSVRSHFTSTHRNPARSRLNGATVPAETLRLEAHQTPSSNKSRYLPP